MTQLDLSPIGNCAVASLVDTKGVHKWFCFPRLDGDPVFNALVNGDDPETGFMDIVVENLHTTSQSYIRNTAILETIYETNAGEVVRVLDFAPRFVLFERNFRPPSIIRRIEPVIGNARLKIRIRPTFNYGRQKPHVSFGSNHIRFTGDERVLRVTSDIGPSYILNEQTFLLDRAVNIFVGPDESLSQNPDSLAKQFQHETHNYWCEWVRKLGLPFEWQKAVIRAAITLKMCAYEETGAIVAALTTSIPEAPNTARNWDYRYCWLRDAYFTVGALNQLGVTRTMEHFVRFLVNTVLDEKGAEVSPLYPIVSSTELAETTADALSGFRNMGPVRIGNAAATQKQTDVYGSVILSASQLFWDERVNLTGGRDLYKRLKPVGEAAIKHALEPDSGVWEFRGRHRVHTYSVAMCWAATHRMGLIAQRVGEDGDVEHWKSQAAKIRDIILDKGVTKEGWFTGAFEEEIVDASTLLLGQIGLVPADDKRFLKTVEVVEKRLLRNGFMLRYDEPDDFGLPETSFLICTFWYIDALTATGRGDEARAIYENLLAHRNAAGLLSEDLHPQTGELWGNFPQAYSLVGLILCAYRLSRTWEQGLWHAS
ncbi:MAG TPA: glycoside hydrolase family 15 protein [Rhizomicrobium sp.]|nr:glycoside hydrolase family 15 protein [Rhizomicrobium sp.]